MLKIRRTFSKEFKSKVVLESLKEKETIEFLAKKYELLPTQISIWKAEAIKIQKYPFLLERYNFVSNGINSSSSTFNMLYIIFKNKKSKLLSKKKEV